MYFLAALKGKGGLEEFHLKQPTDAGSAGSGLPRAGPSPAFLGSEKVAVYCHLSPFCLFCPLQSQMCWVSVCGKGQVPWPEGLEKEEPHLNRTMLTGGSGDIMDVSYSLFFSACSDCSRVTGTSCGSGQALILPCHALDCSNTIQLHVLPTKYLTCWERLP